MKKKKLYILLELVSDFFKTLSSVKKIKKSVESIKSVKKAKEEQEIEASRHEMEMLRIKEEGEKEIEALRKEHEEKMIRIAQICAGIADVDKKILAGKYKDVDGVIHEFDMSDREKFAEVLRDRRNTLIFD